MKCPHVSRPAAKLIIFIDKMVAQRQSAGTWMPTQANAAEAK